MARGLSSRLRLNHIEEDDEDSDTEVLQSAIDPKIALQMADLSNSARDRLTAHDLERDRNVNFAQINSTRKCNQQGTTEAKTAAAKRMNITGWNSFGGIDSTTNLDDIARGQYHRITTSQKVQQEVRQLRLQGKEINAESVDEFRGGSSFRQMSTGFVNRNIGSQQPRDIFSRPSKCLDPAIDPNRVYGYKTKPKAGGDRSQSTREMTASRRRHAHIKDGTHNEGSRCKSDGIDLAAQSIPTEVALHYPTNGNGLGSRARIQRNQNRLWSPKTLVGNSDSGPSTIVHASNPFCETKTGQHVSLNPETKSPRMETKKVSLTPAKERPNAAPTDSPSTSNCLPPASTSQFLVEKPQCVHDHKKLADDFSNWFRPTATAAYSSKEHLLSDEPHAGSAAPIADGNDEKDVVVISREEFVRNRDTGIADNLTDGRLTPVDLSDAFVDQDKTSVDVIKSASNTCPLGRDAQDLMDVQIPENERKALDSRSQVCEMVDDYQQSKLERNPIGNSNMPTSLDAALSKLSTTFDPLHHPNPFDRSTDPRCGTQTSKSSNDNSRDRHTVRDGRSDADAKLQPRVPEAKGFGYMISQPLISRSPNVARGDNVVASKWATASPASHSLSGSIPSLPDQDTNTVTRSTLLGDCSNLRRRAASGRFVNNTLEQSRFAIVSPHQVQKERTPMRHIPTGPGFALLVEELAKKNLSVKTDRRPEEPAFTERSANAAFTQYRESTNTGSATEDEEL